MRKFLLGIILSVLALGLEAQVKFSASLSKDSVLVGQPSTLTLALSLLSEVKDSSEVKWTIAIDSIAPGLEILKSSSIYFLSDDSGTPRKDILIAAEKTGHYPIPPLSVNFKGKTYESNALLLNVFSTIENPEQEEIRGFKESTEVTYGVVDFVADNWLWILLGLIIMVVMPIVIKLVSKKEPKPEVISEPEVIKIPAIDVALEKFTLLDKKNLWQTGQLKEYHSQISYILREFLEDELEISALESPTSDIMKSLKKFHLDSELSQKIKVSLSLTDLVKFAKQKPTEAENRKVIEDAKNAVIQVNKSMKN